MHLAVASSIYDSKIQYFGTVGVTLFFILAQNHHLPATRMFARMTAYYVGSEQFQDSRSLASLCPLRTLYCTLMFWRISAHCVSFGC